MSVEEKNRVYPEAERLKVQKLARQDARQAGALAHSRLYLGKEWWIALLVFIFAFGLFSIGWRNSLSDWFHNLYGGVSTVGASRVLAGEIPYRDFWTMYAPGQFYLLALLFRIFGLHLFTEVVAASAVTALAACLAYVFTSSLLNNRLAGILVAAIFSLAMMSTAYVKRLGSYPTAILLILLILILALQFYRTKKLSALIGAGIATGVLIIFKHDVGFYTGAAIVVGLIIHHLLYSPRGEKGNPSIFSKFIAYGLPCFLIVLPVLWYFTVNAGEPMLQDLIIFPFTDFRWARPERYPSLLPFGLYNPDLPAMINSIANYFIFALPFGMLLLGLVAVGMAYKEEKKEYVALGATFTTAFLLHYEAAHIQINTHIVTLSVYGAVFGAMFYDLAMRPLRSKIRGLAVPVILISTIWLLAFSARPLYNFLMNRSIQTETIALEKVSGFRVTPDEARDWTELSAFVKSHIGPDDGIFVGLHRHDVIVINDILIYFLLDQPIATRYHELHPAIADTKAVQQEIIAGLEKNNVSLIVLKYIFTDEALEINKNIFLPHLPNIGATDLDEYIHQNYTWARAFGPYNVWLKNQ